MYKAREGTGRAGGGGGVGIKYKATTIHPFPFSTRRTHNIYTTLVPLGQYYEGYTGFYDVPVVVVTPQ